MVKKEKDSWAFKCHNQLYHGVIDYELQNKTTLIHKKETYKALVLINHEFP